jgi:hypothetical protein
MLQVFYLDVAYVAVAMHICVQMFVPNVSPVSDICCGVFHVVSVFISRHTYLGTQQQAHAGACSLAAACIGVQHAGHAVATS